MTLTLSDALAEIIRARALECGYASPEDYVAALVESDTNDEPGPLGLTAADRRRIGDLALEALDSGRPGIVADAAYWESVKRRGLERAHQRRADAS